MKCYGPQVVPGAPAWPLGGLGAPHARPWSSPARPGCAIRPCPGRSRRASHSRTTASKVPPPGRHGGAPDGLLRLARVDPAGQLLPRPVSTFPGLGEADRRVDPQGQGLLLAAEPIGQPPIAAAIGLDLKVEPSGIRDSIGLVPALGIPGGSVGQRHCWYFCTRRPGQKSAGTAKYTDKHFCCRQPLADNGARSRTGNPQKA